MNKNSRILFFGLTLFTSMVNINALAAMNNSYLLEEVKVTAPAKTQNLEKISQEVKIIKGKTLSYFGPELFSAFKLNERGAFGVQQDLSIRGSSFEENLVTIEGIRVSSPQTAHHLMNLPLEKDILESVEILPGGASAIYGPGGFGGEVNFNLKPSSPGYKFSIGYGSYNYKDFFGKLGFSSPFSPINIIFSQQKADGFIWDRDFDIRTFNLYTKDKRKTIFYGFQEKDFGARNFYTGKYPEWESTKTHIFLAKKNFYGNVWFVEPAFLYRVNYDTYVLDRNNPDFYKNKHKSQVFRLNFPLRYETAPADYLLGTELSYETLDSSRLGDHLRQEVGFYLWIYPKINHKVFPSVGVRYDTISKNKDIFSYNLGLAYLLNSTLKLRSSFGFSYRIPSFTELYYDSPTVKGNSSLTPEKAYNLEAGFDYSKDILTFSGTIFYRYGKDIIDWIKTDNIIQAQNIETLKTLGFTIDGKINFTKVKPFISYTYLNQIAENLSSARYTGRYLTHNFILGVLAHLPYNMELAGELNYRKYYRSEEVYLINFKIQKTFYKHTTLCLWGKNLLDEDYEEFKGVKAIPQWIGINIEVKF
ncbi:TonB-dependent receptor plug domain-containing protein [Thermodesulfobacterium hydrogeniphilum]|uniref:TonB-dependent receptor plug domain-containing protein n=1 Tax=Thermodesulfobacterium hydrogeniphilum TaxID=161156 RepID=UPI00056E8A8E|nr:TonB-dependent receptor [Thermodesulfobacterium hydrogeniphilum]